MNPSDVAVVIVLFRTTAVDLTWIPAEATVVLVHNDETPCAISPPGRAVVHIEGGGNVGFGRGVDAGAAAVPSARRLIVCNPDTELLPAHWDALVTDDPDELRTLALLDGSGVPTSVVNAYPSAIGHLAAGFRLGRIFRRGSRARTVLAKAAGGWAKANAESLHITAGRWPLTTHWASGAVISVDAERFRAIGGFDPGYFLYFEDIDLCRRLGERFPTIEIVIVEGPPGVHLVAASSVGMASSTAVHHGRSAVRYARGNPGLAWRAIGAPLGLRLRLLERRAPAGGDHGPDGDSPKPRIAVIVSLDRERGMGERARVGSWRAILEAGGWQVSSISLRADHASGLSPRRWPSPAAVLRSRAMPESLSWSARSVRAELRRRHPSAIVFVSARAYHPMLAAEAERIVLDVVDRLGVAYLDRSRVVTGPAHRLAFRALAAAATRFERIGLSHTPPSVTVTMAGYAEATTLDLAWVPIVVTGLVPVVAEPDHDLLFFGSLAYPPNVAAVEALGTMWPAIQAARAGTTALVAGARPSAAVRAVAARHGWTLQADFADLAELCARARVAVVPLTFAAGIQNKVLEAAALGLPQVLSPESLSGFPPDAPFVGHPVGEPFVAAIVDLLSDPAKAAADGEAARRYMADEISPVAWAGWLDGLDRIAPSGAPDESPPAAPLQPGGA